MEILINDIQYNRVFLVENRESKNLSIARNVARKINPNIDAQQLVDAIRTDIPSSRLNQCAYLPGIVRMYLNGEFNDGKTISKINSTLKILANAHGNEYNNDLNGLSASDLINRFATAVRSDFEKKRNINSKKEFSGISDYKIVKIPDAETASKYAKYVSWCVCHQENMYSSYTNNEIGIFYFLLKNGFEKVKKVVGENCPLDEYGLSMVAVSINEDGSINTSTCRWNHDNGGNDNILTDEQLSNLLGQDVYQVLKPRKIETLADNERFRVFKKEDKTILYDKKLDKYSTFTEDGYANAYRSYYDDLIGKVNMKGEFVTDAKYSSITRLQNDGYFWATPGYNNGVVLVSPNGNEWMPTKTQHWSTSISEPSKNGTRLYSCENGYGLINLKLGKEIKPGIYERIRKLEADGNYRVQDADNRYGLINDKLDVVIEPGEKYIWIDSCCEIDGHFVRAVGGNVSEDKEGVIDENGNEILPCIYSDIYDVEKEGVTYMLVKYGSRKIGNLRRGYLRFIDNMWVITWEDGD